MNNAYYNTIFVMQVQIEMQNLHNINLQFLFDKVFF